MGNKLAVTAAFAVSLRMTGAPGQATCSVFTVNVNGTAALSRRPCVPQVLPITREPSHVCVQCSPRAERPRPVVSATEAEVLGGPAIACRPLALLS